MIAPRRGRSGFASAPAAIARERVPRAHFAGADAVRALATIAVVVIHASAWPAAPTDAAGALYRGIDLLARFAVPAFVVLSGVLVAYHHGPRDRSHVTRRLRRSVLPWLWWTPGYIVFAVAVSGALAGNLAAVSDYIAYGVGHLYFLLLVPQLYVAYMLWPRSLRGAAILAALALALQLTLCTLRLHVDGGSNPFFFRLMLWHSYQLFPFWMGYFAVGVLVGQLLRADRRPPSWAAAAALAAVIPTAALLLRFRGDGAVNGSFARGTGAFLLPAMVPYALAITAAVALWLPRLIDGRRRLQTITASISRHSLGIYIVHPIALYIAARNLLPLLSDPLPVSAIALLLLVTITVAVSWIAARLIDASPARSVLGTSRPAAVTSGDGRTSPG